MEIKPVIVSGICKCGHSYEEHHISFIMNAEYWEKLKATAPDHPPYIPEECCYYGHGEIGGMKYNEETREWEYHCQAYRDQED